MKAQRIIALAHYIKEHDRYPDYEQNPNVLNVFFHHNATAFFSPNGNISIHWNKNTGEVNSIDLIFVDNGYLIHRYYKDLNGKWHKIRTWTESL